MTYREAMRVAAREYWVLTLQSVGGDISEASRLSKVNRTDIYRHLKRYGITLIRQSPFARRGRWKEQGL